jgi:hypothetical protein
MTNEDDFCGEFCSPAQAVSNTEKPASIPIKEILTPQQQWQRALGDKQPRQ